jgi:hypothetical protein
MLATIQPPFVACTSDYIVTRTNNRIQKIMLIIEQMDKDDLEDLDTAETGLSRPNS